MVVAAFDFDGTLTRRDTLLPYLLRGLGWRRFLWVMVLCSPWLLGFTLRVVPNHMAKRRLLFNALAGRSISELDGWTTSWLETLPSLLRPDALAQLNAHQAAGHCCVLVSASPDVYLRRAAQYLGFDALLCTELAVEQGLLTGEFSTPNCYGEEKVVRLMQWMASQGLGSADQRVVLHGYGDTPGDKPLLRQVHHAWYRGKPWSSSGGSPSTDDL